MNSGTADRRGEEALSALSAAAAELAQQLDPSRLPRHVAIIMDGNGRWARERGWPRIYGHRNGTGAVREVVTAARALGVKYLTLYAFSMENWQRPPDEIHALMLLLRAFLRRERQLMIDKGIRLRSLGRVGDLPAGVQQTLARTMEATAHGTEMVLSLALSYGGRTEIVDAVNRLLADIDAGRRGTEPVSEPVFSTYLDTAGLPDPDLLIRTSGELRVSNFLLWQIAYAELYITPVYWPDFTDRHFVDALLAYQRRERRFGGTTVRTAV